MIPEKDESLLCRFTSGPVAQLVRAPPCHGGGHGFESRLGRSLMRQGSDENINGILAQLGEHLPYKQRVIGSSPIGPILLADYISAVALSADVAQLAEQLICNQQVIGSSPIIGCIKYNMGGFPSGQRGQTVNLLQIASVVRIHLHPVLILRSKIETRKISSEIFCLCRRHKLNNVAAGWSSLEARRAHNPKVEGSNPSPATLKRT